MNGKTPDNQIPSLAPKKETGKKLNWPALLASLVFLSAGGVFSYKFFAKPVLRVWSARDWKPTPCTIIHSRVDSHSSPKGGGDKYSVEILYSYEVGGQPYKSNRYSFLPGVSSGGRMLGWKIGREGKEEIAQQYPPGKIATCFVNPDDPTDSVLESGITWGFCIGLIPIVFLVVGIWFLFGAFQNQPRKESEIKDSC